MAATMKDLANRTGLGLATISKYFNGGHVLEKNRIAIEAAIQELDFTLNEYARGLKTRKSKTIGVIIPELCNVFVTSIITVMEDILRQKGYGVLVCDSRTDVDLEAEAVQFLMQKMVDGIIIMSVAKNGDSLLPAIQKKLPIVLLDRMLPDLRDVADMVLVDNFGAALESMHYLLQNGHSQVGIVAGPQDIYTSQERLSGYQEALRQSGLQSRESLIYHSDYTVQGGYVGVKKIIAENPDLTALFITNYEMTLGAILALNELGIRFPEQLSVIGFDDLQLAQVISPKLTIVAQPLEEIGKQAAQILLERLAKNGKKKTPETVTLLTQLQIGASVRRI